MLIQKNITIDTTTIKKIRINYVEYAELLRHPYFNKQQVSTIINEKEKNGRIKNITELGRIEGIDSEFVNKIRIYVTCD